MGAITDIIVNILCCVQRAPWPYSITTILETITTKFASLTNLVLHYDKTWIVEAHNSRGIAGASANLQQPKLNYQ